MRFPFYWRGSATRAGVWLGLLLVLSLFAAGCRQLRHADMRPLDEAGMWYRSVEELRGLQVTGAEVAELVKVRQSGVSDAGCVELMRIARARKEPFSSGDAIAGLRRTGAAEASVLELARLNQLGSWAGEAQALRLAGFSDPVLLGVARRRAAGQATLSGASLAKLKNSGLSEAQILELVERGESDAQAEEIITARRRAAGGNTFVRQPHHRRAR